MGFGAGHRGRGFRCDCGGLAGLGPCFFRCFGLGSYVVRCAQGRRGRGVLGAYKGGRCCSIGIECRRMACEST